MGSVLWNDWMDGIQISPMLSLFGAPIENRGIDSICIRDQSCEGGFASVVAKVLNLLSQFCVNVCVANVLPVVGRPSEFVDLSINSMRTFVSRICQSGHRFLHH
jgi:hypothetical protein